MIITDIKQQLKQKDRYSIYVNGKYIFSLSENELLNLGLRVGQGYSQTELEELKAAATEDKAYFRALNLIARRQRSEWELRDYLKRKGYEPELVEKVVARMISSRYLNDKKFAEAWVNNRRQTKATSQRKLRAELQQKRLSEEIINEVLSQDQTDEQEVLKELITKKRRQSRYQDDQVLLAYLIRQGFNYQDIKQVL